MEVVKDAQVIQQVELRLRACVRVDVTMIREYIPLPTHLVPLLMSAMRLFAILALTFQVAHRSDANKRPQTARPLTPLTAAPKRDYALSRIAARPLFPCCSLRSLHHSRSAPRDSHHRTYFHQIGCIISQSRLHDAPSA